MTAAAFSHLAGTTAVVTGAANGIGLATSTALARSGVNLVLSDIDDAALKAAHAHLAQHAVAVHTIEGDVRDPDHLARVAEVASTIGSPRLVMANAGVAAVGRFQDVPPTEWRRLFEVNVLGVVHTVQAMLPTLIDAGRGHVVITGSSTAIATDASGSNVAYAATKHALLGAAMGLRRQLDPSGVSVHYLAPRLTATSFPFDAQLWSADGPVPQPQWELRDADTAETVVAALSDGMTSDRFLISLTPHTHELLHRWAETGEPVCADDRETR
ncbi:MAG: SDR family oxidoreductase [Actinomycetota bacterium]